MSHFARVLAAVALIVATAVPAQAPPAPLSAADSDPVRLGWMQGAPPPADKLIRYADLSFFRFPQTRWSFAHMQQFVPTANVWRGEGKVAALPRAANYTDAIVVLHRGRIVYERYVGVMTPHTQHIAMSVTKSFVGTLGEMLIAEGKLDAGARVSRYVPELEGSAFADATVRQVLDMTTGLAYSENYADPKA